jgi:hypothetical protein
VISIRRPLRSTQRLDQRVSQGGSAEDGEHRARLRSRKSRTDIKAAAVDPLFARTGVSDLQARAGAVRSRRAVSNADFDIIFKEIEKNPGPDANDGRECRELTFSPNEIDGRHVKIKLHWSG